MQHKIVVAEIPITDLLTLIYLVIYLLTVQLHKCSHITDTM